MQGNAKKRVVWPVVFFLFSVGFSPLRQAYGETPTPGPSASASAGIALSGSKFELSRYCSNGTDGPAGGRPCGSTALEPGTLKKFLIDMLIRDIATINVQYYKGSEMGPNAPRASNVPVCDLGRGLDLGRTNNPENGCNVFDGDENEDLCSPRQYHGGEGNFLATSQDTIKDHPAHNYFSAARETNAGEGLSTAYYNGATSSRAIAYQEARALRLCIRAHIDQPELCTGRNWLAEEMRNQQSVGNNTNSLTAASNAKKASCGSPCVFVKGSWAIGNSDNQNDNEDVIKAVPGSCTLEFAWIRGLWPRMIWSAATAPASTPLKIKSNNSTLALKGVFHEILEEGAINITRSGEGSDPRTCSNLKQDIESYALRVRETRSQLDSITRRTGGMVTECRSTDTASDASVFTGVRGRTAQQETSQTLSGDQNTNQSRGAAQRASAAYCVHEAAQLQLYASIGKLALCEVLARAKAKWDVTISPVPNDLINSLKEAVDDKHCKGCSDDDSNEKAGRTAAYAVTMRNWFIKKYLLEGSSSNMPVDSGAGKWQAPQGAEPPLKISSGQVSR